MYDRRLAASSATVGRGFDDQDDVSQRRSKRRTGLTLIELLVATSAVAILAGIAIPNLTIAQAHSHELKAVEALETIATAQTDYHAVAGVYAGSFQVLIDAGTLSGTFFPGILGTRDGYLFLLCADPPCSSGTSGPGSAYKTLAVPASVAVAHRVFSEDDTGLILATIGAAPTTSDEVIDPGVGGTSSCQNSCVSSAPPHMPSQAEIDAFAAELVALAIEQAIPDIDALVSESAPNLASDLIPTSTQWLVVLNALDTPPTDGGLEWSEVLTADLLAVARSVKTTLAGSDPGPSIAPDSALTSITADYQADLSTLLALGAEGEGPPPPVSISSMTGDPVALLLSTLSLPVLGWLAVGILSTALVLVGRRHLQAA